MKILGILVATLLVATQVSATDYQFFLGDQNGSRVSIEIAKDIAITGGLQYQQLNTLMDAAGVVKAGAKATIWMPSIGVEVTTIKKDDIEVIFGAEYQMMFPHAEVTYENTYDSEASQQADDLNNEIENALDKFSSHGINLYAKPVYKLSENFYLAGVFGIRLGYAGINDQQADAEAWFDTTYTQLGFVFPL